MTAFGCCVVVVLGGGGGGGGSVCVCVRACVCVGGSLVLPGTVFLTHLDNHFRSPRPRLHVSATLQTKQIASISKGVCVCVCVVCMYVSVCVLSVIGG